MRIRRPLVFIGLVVLLAAACSGADPSSQPSGGEASTLATPNPVVQERYALQQSLDFTITLTTTSVGGTFGRLDKAHSCERRDTSPQLAWAGVPEGAASLAIVMEDPESDVYGLSVDVLWTHWVLYSIPSNVTELEPGQAAGQLLENGVKQGSNDYGRVQYNGPCPIPTINFEKRVVSSESRTQAGDIIEALHTAEIRPYYIRLYALDISVDLPSGANRDTLLEAIDGHILAAGELTADYKSTKRQSCKTPDLKSCLERLQR